MDWIQWVLSFVGVLGLIVLLFYALRKLNKKVSVSGGNKLRVLDRVNLGRDGMLLVVSVGGKLMLLGVTAQNVNKIADLEMSEDEYLPDVSGAQSFSAIFASQFTKKQHEQKENENDGASENGDKKE